MNLKSVCAKLVTITLFSLTNAILSEAAFAQNIATIRVKCDAGLDYEIDTVVTLNDDAANPGIFSNNDYFPALIGHMRSGTPVYLSLVFERTSAGTGICTSRLNLDEEFGAGGITAFGHQSRCPILQQLRGEMFESLAYHNDSSGVNCHFFDLRYLAFKAP